MVADWGFENALQGIWSGGSFPGVRMHICDLGHFLAGDKFWELGSRFCPAFQAKAALGSLQLPVLHMLHF